MEVVRRHVAAPDSHGVMQAFLLQQEAVYPLQSTLQGRTWSFPLAIGGSDDWLSTIATTSGRGDAGLILYGIDAQGGLAVGVEGNDYNLSHASSNLSLTGGSVMLIADGSDNGASYNVWALVEGQLQYASGTIGATVLSAFTKFNSPSGIHPRLSRWRAFAPDSPPGGASWSSRHSMSARKSDRRWCSMS
jgi:hypothetical protein